MSVQQTVISVQVPDERTAEALRGSFAGPGVRVSSTSAQRGGGCTVILESHERSAEELVDALQPWIDAGQASLHALDESERLELLAGNDPWADAARG
jgi:hypothetical protein